jgi:hypothetical protein
MIKQEIIWTALPNGIKDDRIRLSVFVSPRLSTDENLPHPELGQFPDFAAWFKHVPGAALRRGNQHRQCGEAPPT